MQILTIQTQTTTSEQVKTPYTSVQAEACWRLGWEFKTHKRKKSLRLMRYKFKLAFENINL